MALTLLHAGSYGRPAAAQLPSSRDHENVPPISSQGFFAWSQKTIFYNKYGFDGSFCALDFFLQSSGQFHRFSTENYTYLSNSKCASGIPLPAAYMWYTTCRVWVPGKNLLSIYMRNQSVDSSDGGTFGETAERFSTCCMSHTGMFWT